MIQQRVQAQPVKLFVQSARRRSRIPVITGLQFSGRGRRE